MASANGTTNGSAAKRARKWDEVILVTGAAGFIGSHVATHLVKTYPNYFVITFDRLDYCSTLNNLNEIKDAPNHKFIRGSILSTELVNFVLRSENVSIIMNFAAQTHVDNSFGNSISFTEHNILGTHVLLECAKSTGSLRRFIHVSTDEVYGDCEKDQADCKETEALEPTNPYAASKTAAEYLVKAYHRSFNLPTIITRSNNVYGPHQYPEKLIPKFILRLQKGMPCCIHGSGETMRNFLYVGDLCKAFDVVLHKGVAGQEYNIGTKVEKTVREVTLDILKNFGLEGRKEELMEFVHDRPYNDFRYAIDSAKINALGWKEETSWEEGLRKTVEWYLKHQDHWANYDAALVAHPRHGLDISANASIFTFSDMEKDNS